MERFRKDLGDLTGLKESIKKHGLIHPIVIDSDGVLIAGERRLKACQELGIDPVYRVVDFENPTQAEIDENTQRKDFTASEIFAISNYVNEVESRQFDGINQYSVKRVVINDNDPKKPIDKVSEITGVGTATISKINQIFKSDFDDIKEKVDAGDLSVNEGYREVKKIEKQEKYKEKKELFEKDNPIVENNDIIIYLGDSIGLIDKLNNNSIDCFLTDPPYGMNFKSGWNDFDNIENDKIEDTILLLDSLFLNVKCKLKDDAHIYIFGNINYISEIKIVFEKYFVLKNILIWDRNIIGMGDLKTYGKSYDIIYFGVNKKWRDLNGVRDRDVLRFNRINPNEMKHPTEKPFELLEYLIKKSTNENDLILDTFAGGGSTLLTSKKLNRKCIGMELNKDYYEVIRERLR